MVTITPDELEINRWLDLVDQEAVKSAAVWGIGNLESFQTADMTAKLDRQKIKLYDAIQRRDVLQVADLAAGTIRAYAAMDAAARAAGHTPADKGDFLEYRHKPSGRVYRIAPNVIAARAASAQGVSVWTLEEVVNVLETKQLVNQPSVAARPLSIDATKTSFEEDKLPWDG